MCFCSNTIPTGSRPGNIITNNSQIVSLDSVVRPIHEIAGKDFKNRSAMDGLALWLVDVAECGSWRVSHSVGTVLSGTEIAMSKGLFCAES